MFKKLQPIFYQTSAKLSSSSSCSRSAMIFGVQPVVICSDWLHSETSHSREILKMEFLKSYKITIQHVKRWKKMLLTQSTAHFPSSALVVLGLSSQINLAIVFRTKSTCKPLLKSVQHHRRMEKEIWGKLQELHMQSPLRIWLKICHRQNESRHRMSEHQHQQRVSWLNGMVILRFPIFPTQSCLILLYRFGS